MGKRVATCDVYQVVQGRSALTLVDGDSEIQRLRLFVDREEVRIGGLAVALYPETVVAVRENLACGTFV